MMEPDETYWQTFYDEGKAPSFPSQFAIFTQSWIQGKRCRIYEFGSGNGRDAIFFHGLGHMVRASDQVASADLRELDEQSTRFSLAEGDVAKTSSFEIDPDNGELVIVYSRFFQHAIAEDVEAEMLANLAASLPAGALAFFEFRIDLDEALPKTFGGHFRRYQPATEFVERTIRHGFAERYSACGSGYANYRTEDPIVGRFVFEKL